MFETYHVTLHIPEILSNKIKGYLAANNPDEYQGEDNTIRCTLKAPDGRELDLKCCGCRDESSWTELVVFDEGAEIGCTEPMDKFLGNWDITVWDGTCYKIQVVVDDRGHEKPYVTGDTDWCVI